MSETAAPLPLDGFGVVVTRAEEPGGPLSRRLALQGASVRSWRAIEIAPPEDPQPLARAVAGLHTYDWIVFASAHAVAALATVLGRRSRAGIRVGAVGGATAEAARRMGFDVRQVPAQFGAAGLLADLRAAGEMAGARVLYPASAITRPELEAGLRELGAAVDRVVAYRTRSAALDAARCRAELAAGAIDVVTFTSPSAVKSVAAALGSADFVSVLKELLLVSIGPTTTRALLDHGLAPSAEARPSTLDGVVAATLAAVE